MLYNFVALQAIDFSSLLAISYGLVFIMLMVACMPSVISYGLIFIMFMVVCILNALIFLVWGM